MFKHKDVSYLKRYWVYLKEHKILVYLAFILVPLLSGVHLLQPLLLKIGVDRYIITKDITGLYGVTCIFGVAVVLEFLFRAVQSYVFQYVGQKTVTAMRLDLFKHILGLSSTYFDKTPLGQVTTRLTSDMESLNESFSSGMVTLLSDLLIVLGILVVMFCLHAKLAWIVCLFIPIIVLGVNFFRIQLRKYFNRIRTLLGHINALLQEQLQGVSIVQLFRRQSLNEKEFASYNAQYRKAVIRSVSYDAVLYSFIEALSSVVIAMVLWMSLGPYFGQNAVSLGILVAFVDYIHKMFMPLKDLSNKFTILQHTLAALEKIFAAFDVNDSIDSGTRSIENFKGVIEFKNVSFAYPGYEDKQILKKIDFTLEPGQVVALVGPTGSGKTTISRLVSRLYDGYEGDILLDGVDVRDLKLDDLRHQVAVVLQDVYLMSRSIAFNISLGDERITQERIEWAAHLAQADAFISHLDQGYNTLIDHSGSQLSHGQSQLISLARALASDAPIVLLDEATSSVDSMNEQLIQKGVDNLLKEKTALVIAHRLSTIQKADLILALKDGEIIERGTHEDLMEQDGFYAKLFRMQFSHE